MYGKNEINTQTAVFQGGKLIPAKNSFPAPRKKVEEEGDTGGAKRRLSDQAGAQPLAALERNPKNKNLFWRDYFEFSLARIYFSLLTATRDR